mmetsp:Transcript_29963/g.65499  ORF Transcript_29963/g.65499 Transcript_29963/m.65499 type:complete len:407 (-) Transcript_29963:622-1842(-)
MLCLRPLVYCHRQESGHPTTIAAGGSPCPVRSMCTAEVTATNHHISTQPTWHLALFSAPWFTYIRLPLPLRGGECSVLAGLLPRLCLLPTILRHLWSSRRGFVLGCLLLRGRRCFLPLSNVLFLRRLPWFPSLLLPVALTSGGKPNFVIKLLAQGYKLSFLELQGLCLLCLGTIAVRKLLPECLYLRLQLRLLLCLGPNDPFAGQFHLLLAPIAALLLKLHLTRTSATEDVGFRGARGDSWGLLHCAWLKVQLRALRRRCGLRISRAGTLSSCCVPVAVRRPLWWRGFDRFLLLGGWRSFLLGDGNRACATKRTRLVRGRRWGRLGRFDRNCALSQLQTGALTDRRGAIIIITTDCLFRSTPVALRIGLRGPTGTFAIVPTGSVALRRARRDELLRLAPVVVLIRP